MEEKPAIGQALTTDSPNLGTMEIISMAGTTPVIGETPITQKINCDYYNVS